MQIYTYRFIQGKRRVNNENNLNNWDIKLLKKHLEFYLGLESGKISIDEDGDKVDKIKIEINFEKF